MTVRRREAGRVSRPVRLAVGLSLAFLGAGPGHAAVLVQVDTPEDVVDPNDGKTSLREAFDQANASDDEANIVLQGGVEYRLTICAPSDDDANHNGDLDHLGHGILTISGNGATIRQTCPGARVIDQFGRGLMNLNDVTIMGGDAAVGPGGGVFVRGLGGLDLKNANVYGNHSVAAGGGIASQGDVRLTGTTVSFNVANEVGGGIASFTRVTLVNSTVAGNTVGPQSRMGVGGVAAENRVILVYSTVEDNSPPNVDIRGGQLWAFGSVVAMPRGGGASCAIRDGARSWGYNFGGDASCGFGQGKGDRADAGDPRLGPRQGTGVIARVYPLDDSPLIDAIPTADCVPADLPPDVVPPWANLRADMIGVARPQGAGCDIGAMEVAPEAVLAAASSRPAATVEAPPRTIQLRSAVLASFLALVVGLLAGAWFGRRATT